MQLGVGVSLAFAPALSKQNSQVRNPPSPYPLRVFCLSTCPRLICFCMHPCMRCGAVRCGVGAEGRAGQPSGSEVYGTVDV